MSMYICLKIPNLSIRRTIQDLIDARVITIDLSNKKYETMTFLKLTMPIILILPNIVMAILDLTIFKLKAHTMSMHKCLRSQTKQTEV